MAKVQGPPNDLERREKTRKAGKCQRCGKKTPKQFRVEFKGGDYGGAGNPRAVKETGVREGKSHYCGDCADKRVAEKTRYLNARNGQPAAKPKRTAKPKAKKTAKAKPKAKARKRTVKRPAKKTAKKRAVAATEPF